MLSCLGTLLLETLFRNGVSGKHVPKQTTSFKGDASVYSSRNIARSGCQNANEAIALGASISTAAEFSTICLVDSSVASPLKDVVRLGTHARETLLRLRLMHL